MENPKLLAVFVKYLQEMKEIIRGQLISIQKKALELKTKQQEISNERSEKERQFASITEDTIKNYKILWASLTPSDSYPCPFCFVIHHNRSPLKPIASKTDKDRFKCALCGNIFEA
jgi:hypothetical protein